MYVFRSVNKLHISEFLKDLKYPVSKDEIVKHAEQKGAAEDVIFILENLPENYFAKRNELSRHFLQKTQTEFLGLKPII